ncbi:S-layer homology domain-containing protein [Vallitalea okinawensis]|uniref:S-layer homology domain-containing protein n=1 Tax=Vallitalea okinawensis TaxID=2078660 RepID=UPI000CFB00FF|nr:S-layer homology domain-containing protein [Vallitalea okinawensis]
MMKWKKQIAFFIAFLLLFSNVKIVSNAALYTDVPTWAEDSVDRVSEEGLLVGSTSGNFSPYEKVTYFDLVDVLATMVGYKNPDIDYSIPEEQKNYIDNAYNANKWVIDSYSNGKGNWEHIQDEKIAYLLQGGILDQADLSLFIKSDNAKGYVTKEALSKYLVRVLDLENQAFMSTSTTGFADDGKINSMYKPYVAMLKSLNIISGDTGNNFNPEEEVTRVILAVVIDNVLTYQNASSVEVPTNEYENLKEISGKVVEVYDFATMKAVRIGADTNNTLYKVADSVEIYKDNIKVNGALSEYVKQYDTATIFIADNVIQKIYVGTQTTTTPPVIDNPVDNNTSLNYEEVTGIIENVINTSEGYRVTLKVQYVTLTEIKEVKKEYIISGTAEIRENGATIDLYDVDLGAIATAKVHNGVVYELDTLNKKHTVEGTILSKELYEDKFVIEIVDIDGEIRTYNLDQDTDIDKEDVKKPTFNDIAIGNDVVIEAEYDRVVEIECTSDIDNYEGHVVEIVIATSPKIKIKDEDGLIHDFVFSFDAIMEYDDKGINIYDLKLGYEVEIDSDAKEIYALELKDKVVQDTIEGIIKEVNEDGEELIVQVKIDDISSQYYLKTLEVNGSTKIYENGSYMSKTELEEGMRVIITLDDKDENEADVIHVLN